MYLIQKYATYKNEIIIIITTIRSLRLFATISLRRNINFVNTERKLVLLVFMHSAPKLFLLLFMSCRILFDACALCILSYDCTCALVSQFVCRNFAEFGVARTKTRYKDLKGTDRSSVLSIYNPGIKQSK